MRIAALVVGEGPALAAVGSQLRPPDALMVRPGPWAEAIAAADMPCDWLWLVRGDTRPAPGALVALAAAAEGGPGLPEPELLAGKVVNPASALDRESMPWPPLHDRATAMAAA